MEQTIGKLLADFERKGKRQKRDELLYQANEA